MNNEIVHNKWSYVILIIDMWQHSGEVFDTVASEVPSLIPQSTKPFLCWFPPNVQKHEN